jgi:hypothetical protein
LPRPAWILILLPYISLLSLGWQACPTTPSFRTIILLISSFRVAWDDRAHHWAQSLVEMGFFRTFCPVWPQNRTPCSQAK